MVATRASETGREKCYIARKRVELTFSQVRRLFRLGRRVFRFELELDCKPGPIAITIDKLTWQFVDHVLVQHLSESDEDDVLD